MPRTTRTTSRSDPGLRDGWRSGLEEEIARWLEEQGHPACFEPGRIPYLKPARKAHYTPDFPLHNGIIIESKGRFVTADRQKHILIKDQHPDLDIRFVFSRSKSPISKRSKTTYAMWCEKHGFLYADKQIPLEWLDEPPEPTRLRAMLNLWPHLENVLCQ